uniref:Uncharacterized protein n=1 Tax=Glossina pallidipes TaxID=7398 RepID=A0A1A9ZRL2_GLOPL
MNLVNRLWKDICQSATRLVGLGYHGGAGITSKKKKKTKKKFNFARCENSVAWCWLSNVFAAATGCNCKCWQNEQRRQRGMKIELI